jgi:hypothetical protein
VPERVGMDCQFPRRFDMRSLRITSLILPFFASVAWAGSTLSTSEAARHIGERATVCGDIASEHTATNSHGTPMFINLGKSYPNQVFTVLVWASDRPDVGDLPRSGLICATGTITEYGGTPEIVIHDKQDWYVPGKSSGTPQSQLSNDSYYTNSAGQRVHSPAYSSGGVPSGATAVCGDGTYSFSQHRSSTCSHHGGVSKWL